MVSEHKKYLMQQHSKTDKQQSRFSEHGIIQTTTPQITIQQTAIDYTQQVMCPFCLHAAKLQSFLQSTTKGISLTRAACPECKNGMMMKSLLAEWTPEQYAEWVYPYGRSGFWQKCPFATWKKRLSQIGWAQRFWDRYKQLKGATDEDESYTDYMNRQGEEYAKQWEEEGER